VTSCFDVLIFTALCHIRTVEKLLSDVQYIFSAKLILKKYNWLSRKSGVGRQASQARVITNDQ
jgi:hypothetical protein